MHATDQHGRQRGPVNLGQLEREVAAELVANVLARELGGAGIHLSELGPLALEALPHDLEKNLDRIVQQR
jgi:hypothetical protein